MPDLVAKNLNIQSILRIAKTVIDNQSNVLAIFMVVVVGMLLVPIPAFLLDLAFVINFSISLGIILVTMYAKDPMEFSTFPTVLLLVTLSRLALEISATRAILLNGHAGNVIHSIGEFVIGGNFVVGVIIFIILFVVNFVVVTQGSGRVSEVAARFALDSMPGKQLAVDADLNAGLIDEATAKERRKNIAKEADFYATMDGGSKFVKGDAIASIIIAVVNVVAGFVVGMVQLGLSAGESASLYTLLTVGEGLVAQIPALMISVGTGIIVTRADPEVNLAADINFQLFGRKEVIAVAALTMQILAIGIKGAFLPFTLVASSLGYWAYKKYKEEQIANANKMIQGPDGSMLTEEEYKELQANEQLKAKQHDNSPEGVIKLLKVDQMEIEIGYKLINLIDPDKDGDLMDRIGQIRRQIMVDLGLPIPAIRVHDNLQLSPTQYRVKLRGAPISEGSIQADRFLAVNTGLVDMEAAKALEGEETIEPSYGLPAIWIKEHDREKAETMGFTVATPSAVLATHLTEVIRSFADEILSRQDLERMFEHLKEANQNIIDEVNSLLSLGEILAVLKNLLNEQISVRDLATILELVANFAKVNKDPDFLSERVREGMGRQICTQYMSENRLNCITFHPIVEEELINSLHMDRLAIEPEKIKFILESVANGCDKLSNQGFPSVLLCNNKIRLPLHKVVERSIPHLTILSYSEVPSDIDAQSAFMVQYE